MRAAQDTGPERHRGCRRLPVLTADHLTKRYGDVVAVDDLSFALEPGTITGFLGPNGAGKTTTLRLLLGLAEPTAGAALVLGRRYRELERPMRRVGAVLESGDFDPGRSGRNHLRVLALAARGRLRARGGGAGAGRADGGRAAAPCVRTRWACASGSASPARCSATPSC